MADPVTKGVVVAAAGAVGVGVFPEVLGVPVSVVIAAFAGAAGILSFLPAMPIARMAGTVFFCSAGGVFGASVAVRDIAWLRGADLLAAFLVSAVLQLAVPLLIEHRAKLLAPVLSLWERFFGRKGGGA